MKSSQKTTPTKICINCNKEFRGRKHSLTCSPPCKIEFDIKDKHAKSLINFPDDKPDTWVGCPVCGFRSAVLSVAHLKWHGLSVEEMKLKYPNQKMLSDVSRTKSSEQMSGSNNPWFDHGGKMSPFSSKFVKYTDLTSEEIELKIDKTGKKSKATAKQNNNDTTLLSYYISRGLSETDASKALRNRQSTFSLEKCIEKHGLELGTKRWEARQTKWLSTLDSKTDEEKAEINRKKLCTTNSNVSSKEKKLFELLAPLIPNLEIQFKLQYGLNHYKYDFRCGNKIVEFNGDYWHANPAIHEDTDFIKIRGKGSIPVKMLWEKDLEKKKIANNNGFELLVIWEKDFDKNPQLCVDKIISFMNE